MTWRYSYDDGADETTIEWKSDGSVVNTTIKGKITQWKSGYPNTSESREAVAELIQSADPPERIRMQFDLNYGFENTTSDAQ